MDKLKFKNGDEMPAIGLGTWKASEEVVGNTIKTALKEGFRHLDCAANYNNESAIGKALKETFSEGIIKRKDVWITSKLWNDAHKKQDVIPALKQSLHNLQLDYLDLYLIHWPVAFKPGTVFPTADEDYLSLKEVPLLETWEAMLEAKKQGLTRHVGVSNFSPKKLNELILKSETPEMNQVELHPFLQQPALLEYCRTNNIHLTAYSPLGSGDRSTSMKAENEPSLLENPKIQKIAEKHQASAAQILIKWAITRGTAVIPKATSKKHLLDNLKSVEIELDEEDMNHINELDKNFRYVNGEFFVTEGNSYNNIYDEKKYE